VELDADKVAKLFDVPLPKPAPAGSETTQAQRAGWNPVPVRSSLHGVLIGTAIAEPAKYSLCQITNPDVNETQVYAIGEKYQGARIYAIEKERVLVDNNGVNEYIDNSAAAAPNIGVTPLVPPPPGQPAQAAGGEGVRQLSENQYVVARSEINNALTNLSDLATKARIVPSFKNGVANGFKLFSIVPDSLYAKIGVQNGDVIRRINGYEMNSPDKALEIYQKLRDANRIEVEIERRGETIRKSYSIE
jgi:general secretion pathway protein C